MCGMMLNRDMETTTFQVGATYEMRSAADHDCAWRFTVAARTAKTVTLVDDEGASVRRGVKVVLGAERVMPFGTFSLAPVLSADRMVAL